MTNPTPAPAPDSWTEALVYPLACLGALAGAAAGIGIVWLALRSNMYAMIAVGPLAGLGARTLANRSVKHTDPIIGVMAAIIGLGAAIWTEAHFWPFRADDSLSYFLTHLTAVHPMDLLIIAIGTAIAFFLAWRK